MAAGAWEVLCRHSSSSEKPSYLPTQPTFGNMHLHRVGFEHFACVLWNIWLPLSFPCSSEPSSISQYQINGFKQSNPCWYENSSTSGLTLLLGSSLLWHLTQQRPGAWCSAHLVPPALLPAISSGAGLLMADYVWPHFSSSLSRPLDALHPCSVICLGSGSTKLWGKCPTKIWERIHKQLNKTWMKAVWGLRLLSLV